MDMELKSKKTVLWKLFLSTFYLSTFTFGGGYVIVSLMKKKFVDEYHWIDENEMLDLVAIAQSAPGAVAVNGAIAVGYKLAAYRRGDSRLWDIASAVCDHCGNLGLLSDLLQKFYCKPDAAWHAGRSRGSDRCCGI